MNISFINIFSSIIKQYKPVKMPRILSGDEVNN